LTILLTAIQTSCKAIAFNVRRATLLNLLGVAGSANATGDDQKVLQRVGRADPALTAG
jgi:fructose-1,6-bisphosphatase I